MNIDALTAYLALSSGSYSGILRDMYAVHNLGLNPDLHTKLLANRFVGGTKELSGTPPLSFKSKGKPLTAWSITGNTVQNGTPTPENPVEVFGCGDRTGNLFDNSLLEQGGLKASVGTIPTKLLPGETNYTNRTRYNQIIPLLASTLSLYCPANIKINYVWIDANGISLGGSGFQKNGGTVTAPEQAVSMTFILGLDSDIECTPSDFSDINLVAGSIAPESYEPYGYKIPVVTRGKNLAGNYTVSSGYYYDDSGTPTSSDARFIRLTINVEPNTIYTISSNLKFYSIWEFNNNTKISRFGIGSKKFIIETKEKCNSLRISMWNTSGEADTSAFEWIQLEEGSTATPYEPYHEPITTPIYLSTPLYSGEMLRSDGSRDVKWGVVDLGSMSYGYYNGLFYFTIPDKKESKNDIISLLICEKYIVTKTHSSMSCNNYEIYEYTGSDKKRVVIRNNDYNDTKTFKEAMKGVMLYYELEDPKTETFTAPQIPTLNGTTVIDVDTTVKPESMTIKYRR